jgi:hypothetical protein
MTGKSKIPPICEIEGCQKRPQPSQRMCPMHKNRVARNGSPYRPLPRPSLPTFIDGVWVVPLTRGLVAFIDEEDVEAISKHIWHAEGKKGRVKFYARSGSPRATGSRVGHVMHQFVLGGRRVGFDIDHINGNGLDNRKQNLRFCASVDNMRNKWVSSRNTSGIPGVNWRARDCKWRAYITIDKRQVYLGQFANKHDAVIARSLAAAKYFGEFARVTPDVDATQESRRYATLPCGPDGPGCDRDNLPNREVG